MTYDDCSIDCTGDVVTGDTILFTEDVFGGTYRKPKFLGVRRIMAVVTADSYGAAKQQHTFSLDVIRSDGVQPVIPGTKTRRKGRNIYGHYTLRMPWENESNRKAAANEKHKRGEVARRHRDERRTYS